ncbi:MAG: hypothetical protein ACJLUP_21350 [Agrobacterium tumefaciens]
MTTNTRQLCTTALLGLALSLSQVPATAETVMLSRGDDTFGQGWLFLDGSGNCRIATPRHVIEAADGTLTTPDLLDSFGRLHPTANPLPAADADLDLAFLTVGGPFTEEPCSRDRVQATPLQPIIDRIKQATLEITTPTERQSITVAFRALSRDSEGGKIIALSATDAGASLQKGMSGGTIMYNGRPIAMLYEVDPDEGIGVALRYDQIAVELQKVSGSAKPQIQHNLPFQSLMLAKGRISKRDSSIGAFLAETSPLYLSPSDDRVTLVVEMEQLSNISGIRLSGQGLSGQGALIVETDTDGQGFVPGARCELSDDLTCTMSPRRASRLRLTLTGLETANYVLENLEPFSGERR